MKYAPTLLILVALLTGCGVTSNTTVTAANGGDGKITVKCPEARLYLPDYPSPSDREAFFNDSLLYRRSYALRDSERGIQAINDARTDISYYLQRFGAAMGVNLSKSGTPAIAKYLKTAYNFARDGISTAKKSFSRQRPYSYFQEGSAVPEDEGPIVAFLSYPSGHTVRAWTIALALVAIDDVSCNEVIKVALEIGESRIIAGFHYASDVEAARMSASVSFAKIISDPEFAELMRRARSELDSLRASAVKSE